MFLGKWTESLFITNRNKMCVRSVLKVHKKAEMYQECCPRLCLAHLCSSYDRLVLVGQEDGNVQ